MNQNTPKQFTKTFADFQEVNYSDGSKTFEHVNRAVANSFYYDSSRNIQVRPPYERKHYEQFRPNERIPEGRTQEEQREIMMACIAAYERVGVIRSVIDMMSEFAAEGVDIIHEEEGPHQFYQNWKRKVNLEDRVERFLSWLFKSGNVIVRRKFGQLDTTEIRKMRRGIAELKEKNGTTAAIAIEPGRIPLEYVFYNPATIELVGGVMGAVSDNKIYALRIPMNTFLGMRPTNDLERKVYEALPPEIKDVINGKSKATTYYVPIPKEKVWVGHYKKDDTDIWAKSFIYSILSDVYYNDKVKMAKTSAMDGMINVIRLWKLGDHTAELLPAPAAGSKLANVLGNNVGAGPVDIIWDSAIELEEFYPPVENLANFEESYHSILLGLGVPEVLAGGTGGQASPALATIGLKNMIKRLEAGRRIVRAWLESEIDIIQQNMGFRKRPQIRFSNADLFDERTYFTLLKELVDRNILPEDRLLEIINEIPEFENVRMRKQEEERKAGKRPPKASPFHNPQLEETNEFELKKIEKQAKLKPAPAGPGGGGGNNSRNLSKKKPTKTRNGRPPGSRDKVTRKRRPNRVKADILLQASKVHDAVEEYVTKVMLEHFGAANVRSLNAEQKGELEQAKAFLLPHVSPFSDLSEKSIVEAYEKQEGPADDFYSAYQEQLRDLATDKVTAEQKKILRVAAYVEAWLGILEEEDQNGV
jgi:hypothetical protein